jgi:DNA-binding MarR family transcriptional regulator
MRLGLSCETDILVALLGAGDQTLKWLVGKTKRPRTTLTMALGRLGTAHPPLVALSGTGGRGPIFYKLTGEGRKRARAVAANTRRTLRSAGA